MSRVFIIDQANGFIYSRKEFTRDGKLLFERRFEEISFDTATEDDFKIDLPVEGEYRFFSDVLAMLADLKLAENKAIAGQVLLRRSVRHIRR
ncbi:MAG: hypothetical protein MJ202_08190 [Lentisphaeria bacterium]|nr:hypothetical protein [Lentisphaeria bacterium]